MQSSSTNKLTWSQALKLCESCTWSGTAQNLAKRARKGWSLTQKQIALVYKYADRASQNLEPVPTLISPVPQFPVQIEVFGQTHTLIRRPNGWIVESLTDRVVGREVDNQLIVFPNPVFPGSELRRYVRLRSAELVRQERQTKGPGDPH